jgi:hypothetical protein
LLSPQPSGWPFNSSKSSCPRSTHYVSILTDLRLGGFHHLSRCQILDHASCQFISRRLGMSKKVKKFLPCKQVI